MEHLIEYSDYQVKMNPELLLVKPFRVLHNADRTKNKDVFMSQLAIIYFMVDPRSTYNYITDEKERLATILEQEGLPKDYKIDAKLKECMEIYKKHTVTTSYLLLQDMRTTIDKIRAFIKEIDLKETDDKDRPKYQISTIVTSLDKALALIPKIQETEKIVKQELEEKGRARGIANKKLYEDGFDD